ncbi:hypothetical protein [Streptomyces sp. NPDC005953]|uniref:hypothetical protein n=1 Tax=Streptomyces sp. NPDC005953 TaxID=3156719 RepID=UPI0033FDDC3C
MTDLDDLLAAPGPRLPLITYGEAQAVIHLLGRLNEATIDEVQIAAELRDHLARRAPST